MTPIEIKEAVSSTPQVVNAALADINPGLDLKALLAVFGGPARDNSLGDIVFEYLESKGELKSFELAYLRHSRMPYSDITSTHLDPKQASTMIEKIQAARCLVLVNGQPAGSGCLVGPSLVLTAAHVVDAQGNPPQVSGISVQFADGKVESVHDTPVVIAPHSVHDTHSGPPVPPYDYGSDDDFVLLRLRRPAGGRYYNISLPPECWSGVAGTFISLAHFPEGTDYGLGQGSLISVTNPSERWCHSVPTRNGSSGGACFNNRFTLIGIHQGRWPPSRRIVPLPRFVDRIRDPVKNELVPDFLWSLTGTLDGDIVIGRDDLFEAIGVMLNPDTRFRGLRVRRVDASKSEIGLGFTYRILETLIGRNNTQGRVLFHFGWPPKVPDGYDMLRELERKAADLNWLDSAGAIAAPPGVGEAETTLAGTLEARAAALADALQVRADVGRYQYWIVFANPPSGMGLDGHIALEAFVRAALNRRNLRVVVLGTETASVAGIDEAELSRLSTFASTGLPIILNEWLGTFSRNDVENTVRRAFESAYTQPAPGVITHIVTTALHGVSALGNSYPVEFVEQVKGELQRQLRPYFP